MLVRCSNCKWEIEAEFEHDFQPDGTPIQPCPNCDYPTLEIVKPILFGNYTMFGDKRFRLFFRR